MDLTNIEDLRVALQLGGLRARKALGQHFLVDRPSLEAVMAAGDLGPDDSVLEIGPGLGVMTVPLTKVVKKVVAVEADKVLAELLMNNMPSNLEVVHQDILHFNLQQLSAGYKVVANIPYYLTSSLIRLLLESSNRPELMSLLIQKEVAQRIVAEPGQMSILALSVQYYGQPKLVQVVERHKFWPAPKVDSAILQVKVYEQPLFEADPSKLFRLIKAGFGEKRKMLKNSLSGGMNIAMPSVESLIKQAGISATARAQELSLDEWRRLYAATTKRQLL